MNKINDLEEKPVGKLLAQYAIPATLSLVVNALYQMVDRIYIGHIPEVGVLGLTGVELTAPITTIIMALSALFAFGAASTALGLFYFRKGKPTLHLSRKTMRPGTSTLKSIIRIGSIHV